MQIVACGAAVLALSHNQPTETACRAVGLGPVSPGEPVSKLGLTSAVSFGVRTTGFETFTHLPLASYVGTPYDVVTPDREEHTMATLSITIEMDNDSFYENEVAEVKRILAGAVERLESLGVNHARHGETQNLFNLRDYNGNTVGSVDVSA